MKLLSFLLSTLFVLNCYSKSIVLTEANSVSINQPITSEFLSKKKVEILGKAQKLGAGGELYLVLNTPGGEVLSGMIFINNLNSLNIKVHTITIFAASMGYQMVQHLGDRFILPSGILMSHRAAVGGLGGQINGELNARVNFFTNLSNAIDAVSAERVGMTLKAYQKAIVNELWTSGEDAVNTHHADALVEVTCENSLAQKTYVDEINTLFGTIKAKFSACPLITDPLEVSVKEGTSDKAITRVKLFYSNMPLFIKERL